MNSTVRVLFLGLGLAAIGPAVGFPIGTESAAIFLRKGFAIAQTYTSYYYAGTATTGEQVLVDLDSISTNGSFNYLIGNEQLPSQANCNSSPSWTTLHDATVHYPQSQATQDMLRIVCSYLESPTSSVASSPRQQSSSRQQVSTLRRPSNTASLPTPIEPPTPTDGPIPIAVEPYASTSARQTQPTRPTLASPNRATSLRTALVYDPSSNVRATPNGQIICSIDTVAYINILGRLGDWYDTDACGRMGVIHSSQISFD
ncbi:MAG: hypothetical protein AAFY72_10500 [Cyanobacteria bacterium J06649_4]